MPRHSTAGSTSSFYILLGSVALTLLGLAFGCGIAVGRMTAPPAVPPPPIIITVPAPTKPQTPARQFINCIIDQECPGNA